MLIRFPQRYGDPIKSSYLLFTTPCWAIFSVAAWSKLREHHRRLNLLLVVIAVLYVARYAADLDDALAQPSGLPSVGAAGGFVDLSVGFQQTSPVAPRGNEVDFLTSVTNAGNQTAGGVVLTVGLPAGHAAAVFGHPVSYERGTGCTGSRTIDLPARLSEPGGASTDHPLRGRGHGCRPPDDHG